MADLADFFKNFGDTTRVKIISALLISELCVNDIADTLHMSVSAVSHQLRVLKQAKIVRNRREGKTIFYALDDDHVEMLVSTGFSHIEHKRKDTINEGEE